ncbi:MAG TPA: hypothetical protein DDZ96_12020 [Porphyromonadaceae bacterium]|jgi:hypothetical protein|uniref:porin family protein n=1 Tax=Limibacterium fermenti TaxID=3229863 RepID=UPI000E835AB8|nr:hypothetical protein [Porphyromonadaceae bacterium]HBL34525.1 hypothetical protein [Porphyromonadaceae bacterium]HBX46049.1 hypothetical protein [Porphyromonadaceae bacterium]
MKRYALIVFLIGLNLSVMYGQANKFKGEFYVGAGAGALVSSVSFSPGVAQSFHLGMHAGIAAKYISEEHLGVIAEINFAQRGWKEDYDAETGFSYNRTMNYVEIPFLWHVYFGNKVRFIFNAGPQVSILFNHSSSMSEALAADVETQKKANPDNAFIGLQYADPESRFDYGLIGGVGLELRTGIGDFDLEGRYYFGLADFFRYESRKTDFSRAAHRVIEAKLTYYIKF